MAYSVELAGSADRELAKLDARQRKRILKFLQGRVAKLEDPRSVGALEFEAAYDFLSRLHVT